MIKQKSALIFSVLIASALLFPALARAQSHSGFIVDEDQESTLSMANALDNDPNFISLINIYFSSSNRSKLAAYSVVQESSDEVIILPAQDFTGTIDGFLSYYYQAGRIVETRVSQFSITVQQVNDPPTLLTTSLSGSEDSSLQNSLLFDDIDQDTVEILSMESDSGGSFEFEGADFTFIPAADFSGEVTVSVLFTDGVAVVTDEFLIILDSIPDKPSAVPSPGPFATNEDTPLQISLGSVFIDPDGEGLVLLDDLTQAEFGGTITFDPDEDFFTYIPSKEFSGVENLAIFATDGSEPVYSLIKVTVNEINDSPTVISGSLVLSTEEDVPLEFSVADAISDIDSMELSFEVIEILDPSNGSIAISDTPGALIYTPATDYDGTDEFGVFVSVNDGNETVFLLEYSIQVDNINDTPSLRPISVTMREDFSIELDIADFIDDVDSEAFSIVSASSESGSTSFDGTLLTFVPTRNLNGEVSIEVSITDGNSQADGTVTIDILPEPDPVKVLSERIVVYRNQSASVNVLANDFHPDSVSFRLVSATAQFGEVSPGNDGTISYTAEDGFVGMDIVIYLVEDDFGLLSTGLLTVQVLDQDPTTSAASFKDGVITMPLNTLNGYNYSVYALDSVTQSPSEESLIQVIEGNGSTVFVNIEVGEASMKFYRVIASLKN